MTPEDLARSGSEAGHQRALFAWAASQRETLPELALMFAIPNGAKSGDKQARIIRGGMLKAEGVKAGVPDIFLPVCRQGKAGLFIELKRPASGRGAKGVEAVKQSEWIERLRQQGYGACTCVGWERASHVLQQYLA